LWRRARWGALRLVGLGEEGVKILEVNTELRGDKLYATIRAVVDGVEEVYKIQILPPAKAAGGFLIYT